MIDSGTFIRIIDMAKARAGIRHDTEICRAVGISPQLFSQYRKKPCMIPIPALSRICNYLSIPLDERGTLLQ